MIIPFLDLIFLQSPEHYQKYIEKGKPVFDLSVQYAVDMFYYTLSSEFLLHDNGKERALIFVCSLVVSLFFLKNLFRYLAQFVMATVRNGIMRDIRNKLFSKILELPLSYYSEKKKGDIISRMTSDVQEIEWTILQSLEMIFKEPVTILIYLLTMVYWSPKLTVFVFVFLPISGLIIGKIGKSLKESAKQGQGMLGVLISTIDETLSGLRVIKGFNAEKSTLHRFLQRNELYRKLMIKLMRKKDLASPLSEFMGVIVMVVVIWFGGKLVLNNDADLSASTFIAYIALFSQLISPAKSFSSAYYHIQKGAASEERISEILKAENPIKEKPDAISKKEFNTRILYRNVWFKYQQEWVLKDVSIEIKKGQKIALVGASGGGKSTLADLLPRFYDVNKGAILIDDIDIRDLKIHDLRNLMGIVTQESILFNDTVFNNIAFGRENVSEEEVVRAAKIANAHDFIMQLEQGYQTNIGDRGNKLSGGQKQRISIARAVLKNPPILILDEATSALDTESEKQVQDALNKLMENRTSLVIAHRLSTIKNADLIYVIEKGRVLEKGSHEELIALNGIYKKLVDFQAFD